jgi:predicted MFS family arabinose efflux permease
MTAPQPTAGAGPRGSARPSLTPAQQARGRRLALASHPFHMTFRRIFTEDLPTLALVSLGAGDAAVGFQRAFEPLSALVQLPSLRALTHMRKRSLLLLGQAGALLGGLPLLFFPTLVALGPQAGVGVALASLAFTAAGLGVAETPWFPLLHGYVPSDRIGRFFGTLRSSWHLALIVGYLAAQRWLSAHPGRFAPVFAAAWLCGLVRVALVLRLPEAGGVLGERIRVRRALRALAAHPELRRYLLGVSLAGGARRVLMPFAIVVMRRVIGMTEAQVLLATLASFVGGFIALYAAGRAADRVGSAPIFRACGLGLAALALGMCLLQAPGPGVVALAAGLFCGIAGLAAAFGVADTNVLFALAPAEDPTAVLTTATAVSAVAYAIAPIAAGLGLQLAIAAGVDELHAYRTVFALSAVAFATSWIQRRRFGVGRPLADP